MPASGGRDTRDRWTNERGVDFGTVGSNTQCANSEYWLYGARSNSSCSPRKGERLARLFAFLSHIISESSTCLAG
jgi:hypothetical protein